MINCIIIVYKNFVLFY